MTLPVHDECTAPEASKAALARTRKSFGMIPNLERVMASSPALLEGYTALWGLFDSTDLTPIERQVVYLTANFENECDYCVPWHTLLAERAGMPAGVTAALREGAPLPDGRLEALRSYTRALIANRGRIVEAELQAFLGAGYSHRQALEVVLGIAIKVMSNYTNSIAGTPLDNEVRDRVWRKPRIKVRDVVRE